MEKTAGVKRKRHIKKRSRTHSSHTSAVRYRLAHISLITSDNQQGKGYSETLFHILHDYEEYVIRYSTKYKCDPVLVFSVIKVESGFK